MSITKEELEGIWSSEDKAYQYATAELIQQLLHRIKVHIKTVNRTRAYRQSTSPAFDVTNCLTGINVKSEDLYVLRVISPKHAKDVAELVVRDLGARSLSQIAEDWIANDFITELKRVSDVADVNGINNRIYMVDASIQRRGPIVEAFAFADIYYYEKNSDPLGKGSIGGRLSGLVQGYPLGSLPDSKYQR